MSGLHSSVIRRRIPSSRGSPPVIDHIDMVILDIDKGYGLMISEMTVSIRSSPISIWISCHSAGHSSAFQLNLSRFCH